MGIDEAILIMENERPHCGDKLTFTEEERYEAYTLALMALRDLQRAYDEGYKQGRYDEKVETEMSLPNGEQTHALRTETHACDLISRQFGRLTVIDFEGIHTTPCGTRRKMWRCRCECGNESVVAENNLKNGTTKSCGCWKHEKLKEHNTLHGGSNDRLYGIWKNMKRRCDSPNDKHYKTYGGKGVKVCEEWSNNYQSFKEWAYANGYDDSAEFQKCTLDRVDNDGDYEPSNCRWVDRITQANNTSKNHHVELNGIKMTIAEFARAMNISKNHAWYYIDKFEREVMNGQQFDKASGGDRGIDS